MSVLLSKMALRMLGWKAPSAPATLGQGVIIAAPHTSNWDFVYMMLYARAYGLNIHWLGKHTLFTGALGWFLTKMNGVPVDRRNRGDLVKELGARLAENPNFVLAIPPEGTRSRREVWKSGFYHIAREAGVNIIPTALDYGRKFAYFGTPISASRSAASVMDELRLFYKDVTGKFPHKFSEPRLSDETVGSEDKDQAVA